MVGVQNLKNGLWPKYFVLWKIQCYLILSVKALFIKIFESYGDFGVQIVQFKSPSILKDIKRSFEEVHLHRKIYRNPPSSL